MPPEIVLASGSRIRREMLERAGVPFRTVPADVDEDAIRREILSSDSAASAEAIALELAKAKAVHVSRAHPLALVIGADQTLSLAGRLVSKSPDLPAARILLLEMRGRTHQLHAAVAIACAGEVVWSACDSATLHMREFSHAFVDAYLADVGERVLSSVGCYELEGRGINLFESIDGDFFTILGLPLVSLLRELRVRGALLP